MVQLWRGRWQQVRLQVVCLQVGGGEEVGVHLLGLLEVARGVCWVRHRWVGAGREGWHDSVVRHEVLPSCCLQHIEHHEAH